MLQNKHNNDSEVPLSLEMKREAQRGACCWVLTTALRFFQSKGKLKTVCQNRVLTCAEGSIQITTRTDPDWKPVCRQNNTAIHLVSMYPFSKQWHKSWRLQSSMCKFPAVISSSFTSVLPLHQEYLRSSVQEAALSLFMCPWALSQPLGQHPVHTGSPGALQCGSSSPLSLPVYVVKSTVSPLLGLPDPPITFDWAQFRLGVWGQGAPGGFGARSQCWAGGSLCGAQVAHNPEGPHVAVHPSFEGLTHKLGVALSLLHGGLLGRQPQHGAQLLETLLQVLVPWRTCMEPAVLFWSGHSYL